jgi:TolB protein
MWRFAFILIMSNKVTRREFAATLLMTPLSAALLRAQQIDNVGISVSNKVIRIAVPIFAPTAPDPRLNHLADVFNETLWNDLDNAGGLDLASRSFYPLGKFAVPGDIHPEDWTKTGVDAQYITYGDVLITSSGAHKGEFTAEVHLMDLKLRQEITGQRMFGGLDTDESARLVAHSWADQILESLGLGKGVAMTKIAYVSERGGVKEIYTMDYDGSGVDPLTAIHNLALTPAWSPDGDRVAFQSFRGNETNIEVISLKDGTSLRFPSPIGQNSAPAWSPDGQRIAFTSTRGNRGSELYVAEANGRNITRIAPRVSAGTSGDLSPTWNPATGHQIAFVSDRSGSQQIYRMNDDGTSLTRLIDEGGDAEMPAWSRDGNFLAFTWKKSGTSHYDIYILDLIGGKITQLTQNAGDNEKPTWSPNGKLIAFESNRGGSLQVYSMLANGSKVRQLTRTGINKSPAWSGYIKP